MIECDSTLSVFISHKCVNIRNVKQHMDIMIVSNKFDRKCSRCTIVSQIIAALQILSANAQKTVNVASDFLRKRFYNSNIKIANMIS